MNKFAILIFLFLLLAACGDNSERGNSTSSLSVLSVTPSNNSTEVDLSISASATLNNELASRSITPENFYLSLNGEKIGGTVTYDPATRTVELKPQVPLQPEERYTVVLSGAIEEVSGNTLGEDRSWEFITRKRRWSSEKQFTESNGTKFEVVADGLGNDYVAWEDFGNQLGSYHEAMRDEWGSTAAITQPPYSGYFSLAIGRDGIALATWAQYDGLSSFANVYASRYNPTSGNWDAPVLLENLDGDPSDLRLLTDSRGNAFVIWTQSSPDHSESHIYCNRFDNDIMEWSGALPVEDESGEGVLRHAAIDTTGNVVVAWERWSGSQVDAVVSCYDVDNKSWGPPHTLAGPGTIIVQVGFDPAGRALAILATDDPDLPIKYFFIARQDVSGDSWGEPLALDTRTNSRYPSFHVDPLGNIFAVWFGFNGNLFDLMINRYDATIGVWGTPVVLEPFLSNPIPPEIAFDQWGNALLINRVAGMVGSQIYAFRFSAKHLTWGPAEPLQRPDTWGDSPVLSLGPEGQGIVAWRQWPQECLYVRRYE